MSRVPRQAEARDRDMRVRRRRRRSAFIFNLNSGVPQDKSRQNSPKQNIVLAVRILWTELLLAPIEEVLNFSFEISDIKRPVWNPLTFAGKGEACSSTVQKIDNVESGDKPDDFFPFAC
jgi:hypothetical protein